MDTISATQVLSGLTLVCATVVIGMLNRMSKRSAEHDAAFARLEALLTGASGDNGLVGDVKQLRERSHTLGEKMQHVVFRLAVLEDRRSDEPGRRAGDAA